MKNDVLALTDNIAQSVQGLSRRNSILKHEHPQLVQNEFACSCIS